jgi:hypothetical protein
MSGAQRDPRIGRIQLAYPSPAVNDIAVERPVVELPDVEIREAPRLNPDRSKVNLARPYQASRGALVVG